MKSLSVKQYGFHGCFYPTGSRKDKAIITVTGSDGGIGGAQAMAKFYVSQNIPALAVAYFRTNQTPKYLSEIPVDYIEAAVNWLKEQGYKKIAIDGISKGAELALLAASLIPDITCVIARSTTYFVREGLGKGKNPTNKSSWSWHGRSFPCTMYNVRSFDIMKHMLQEREFSVIKFNKNMKVTDESIIHVEKINGPILMLSSKIDTVWPSSDSGETICKRLEAYGFKYPYRHEIYKNVSHYLTPMDMWVLKLLFKVERKQPEACSQSRKEALAVTLDWVNNIWN
jgi:esterase/lipase